MKEGRVLCKFCDKLVIAVVSVRPDNSPGKCPQCGCSSTFVEQNGWIECDCGFAYLKSDIEKLTQELEVSNV